MASAAATTWVALLRGINLGRSRRVSMADLRAILERAGYGDVRTVLQSGNAVFTGSDRSARSVEKAVASALESELGMSVGVVVRSAAELADVVAGNPFADRGLDGKLVHAVFLSADPAPGALDELAPAEFEPNEFHLADRVIYECVPDGLMASTLPDWGKLLGLTVTSRNWNTVTRLERLASG